MEQKIIKRGYNFTEELLSEWEKFHFPSKDYSPSAGGAFLIWMALPPDIREKAKHAAHNPNMKKSIAKMREVLTISLSSELVRVLLAQLPEDQQKSLILGAKQAKEKLSR
ncbi:MAG: hypothetical protein DRP56_06640 [Planctomycetota bacterium]|nr:MAG: hypothetical protein DRP56_06640 [Planctomycetota bacterium]